MRHHVFMCRLGLQICGPNYTYLSQVNPLENKYASEREKGACHGMWGSREWHVRLTRGWHKSFRLSIGLRMALAPSSTSALLALASPAAGAGPGSSQLGVEPGDLRPRAYRGRLRGHCSLPVASSARPFRRTSAPGGRGRPYCGNGRQQV